MKSLLRKWGNTMNSFLTVVKYTFKQRFSSKSSLITIILLSLLITIGINVPYIISMFAKDEVNKIGMIQGDEYANISEKMSTYFAQLEDSKLEIVPIPHLGSKEGNEQAAREQIANGELTGYLTFTPAENGEFPHAHLQTESEDMGLIHQLTTALQLIKTEMIMLELGLSSDQLAKLNAPVTMDTIEISKTGTVEREDKSEKEKIIGFVVVYVLIIFLFMGVTMYGNMIATEVTAEKSSRVMEILITSISPLKQMFGKVIGMMLLALVQICIFITVAVINITLPHNIEFLKTFDVSLSDIPLSLIFGFVFFYLTGFLMYAFVYAAVGSLVSRTEELAQATTPLTMVLLAAFYIAIFGLNTPDSTFMIAMSYVPLFTPMLMFLRMGAGEVATWEVLISVVLMIVTIGFMGWLSTKIYRVGVLMYGKRPSLKEVRKALKAYKI